MRARILFVDDETDLEPLILQKFRRQVRSGELAFCFVHDGKDALDKLANDEPYDLVISDINMPRMDGLTLLDRLQEREIKLLTVIVSAYGDMSNIRTAMNRGAFDFLTKPIDFQDLETTIEKTMNHAHFLREMRDREIAAETAMASMARYFSPNLAERIADPEDAISLAGQRREIAALFTDIEGFTTLAETLAPPILTELLNDYLSGMADIVFEHEGTLAKIVGDALNVLFGAPGEQNDHATRAISCALAMDSFCEDLRKRWLDKGVMVGVTRIGVHAGPAIVGNFGGNRFFDYTAYGDTVNVAARLEGANKQIGTRICVSDAVVLAAENFSGRPIGELVLRGRKEAIRTFEPLSSGVAESEDTKTYQHAFDKLTKGDPDAVAAFAALVGSRPHDRLASYHLKRLLNDETGTVIGLL